MEKEIDPCHSGLIEQSQGSGIEAPNQTVPYQLQKKDTSLDVEMKTIPKENVEEEFASPEADVVLKGVSCKASNECEMTEKDKSALKDLLPTTGPKVFKEVLSVKSDECEISIEDSSTLEVGKVTNEVLLQECNQCNMHKTNASRLAERVTSSEANIAKVDLHVECKEYEMQTESAEASQGTKNEENVAKASKKEVVVIESVIQILPADSELGNTASTELESIAKPNMGAKTTDAVTSPDTDIVGVVSIAQAENNDKPIERQLMPVKAAPTGLGLLSQYGSESDETISSESETESVVEVPTASNKNYRTQIVEIESDSSETISSDSESETESEYLTKISKAINKRITVSDDENIDDDDDDDEINDGKNANKRGRRQPPRVRGEMLLEDLPPIQDLQISMPAEECIEFGRVHSIVDQLLLVSALPNAILLDLDTVLFLEQGKRVLGVVFDVLGQVADPLYCVRFNTNQHIHEKGIKIGDVVYVAPKSEHTQYVILSSLTKLRGSDASWENDIEPPPRYLDYSDDEEEREARQKLRKHRRQSVKEEDDEDDDTNDNDNDPMKRSRLSAAPQENKQRRERHSGSRRNDNSTNYQKRHERFGSQPRSFHPHHHSQSHQPNHHTQNASSWHSHYNPQYHPRPPPTQVYRSPYTAPYQYQRSPYHTSPPQPPHFNPYVHPPMPVPPAQGQLSLREQPSPQVTQPHQMHSMPPPMHMLPPQPSVYSVPTQSHMMSPPPSVHSMPPPTHMTPPPTSAHSLPPPSTAAFVPNPFAFHPPTLSQKTQTQTSAQSQSQSLQQHSQPQSPMQSTSTAEPAPPGAD